MAEDIPAQNARGEDQKCVQLAGVQVSMVFAGIATAMGKSFISIIRQLYNFINLDEL